MTVFYEKETEGAVEGGSATRDGAYRVVLKKLNSSRIEEAHFL